MTRGLGSTIIRAFPMNAATFYIYNLVMKSCAGLFNGGSNAAAAGSQVYERVRDRLGGLDGLTNSSSSSWSRKRSERLTTITTDMPNILLVQQPATISQVCQQQKPSQKTITTTTIL